MTTLDLGAENPSIIFMNEQRRLNTFFDSILDESERSLHASCFKHGRQMIPSSHHVETVDAAILDSSINAPHFNTPSILKP